MLLEVVVSLCKRNANKLIVHESEEHQRQEADDVHQTAVGVQKFLKPRHHPSDEDDKQKHRSPGFSF